MLLLILYGFVNIVFATVKSNATIFPSPNVPPTYSQNGERKLIILGHCTCIEFWVGVGRCTCIAFCGGQNAEERIFIIKIEIIKNFINIYDKTRNN